MLEAHFTMSDDGISVAVVDSDRVGCLARIKVERVDDRQVAVVIDGENASIRRVAHHEDQWIYVLHATKAITWRTALAAGFGGGLGSAIAVIFWL